jgi:quercetin dioxygenase-like cupin family protein
MHAFSLLNEQEWNPKKHVEKVLGEIGEGDVTVACWEPGQVSPNHCHPDCTEIYFCFSGGGTMRTPTETIAVTPGAFVVHPPGEVHEYINGPARTLLFRVRYGKGMSSRHFSWPSNPDWKQKPRDAEYFQENPPG